MKKQTQSALYLLLTLLFLVGVVWAFRFAHRQHAKRVCDTVKIFIHTDNTEPFITEHEIIEQLSEAKLYPEGQITDLNVHIIEDYLSSNSAIQSVDVFTQLSGEMVIHVLQRQPIVRIENNQREQFYIASDGCLMPTSPNRTARLIIANGHIPDACMPNLNVSKSATDTTFSTPTLQKIYQLVTYICKDDFLNALIDQIYVNSKNEFELVPKINNQLILLGHAENYEDQFKRLLQFYHHGVKKVGWNVYKIINLKYNNQIVCTKT